MKDNLMQTAFDEVWEDWNHEQGAMIYAQVVSALDLLNLTGVLANRREITALKQRVEALENRDEVRGWLLDVRLRDDEATLWVKTAEKRVELRCRYHPDFFVVPDKVSFNEFMDLFDEHPHIPAIETHDTIHIHRRHRAEAQYSESALTPQCSTDLLCG